MFTFFMIFIGAYIVSTILMIMLLKYRNVLKFTSFDFAFSDDTELFTIVFAPALNTAFVMMILFAILVIFITSKIDSMVVNARESSKMKQLLNYIKAQK